MASYRVITGFESGYRDNFNLFSDCKFVDNGGARTGEWHLEFNANYTYASNSYAIGPMPTVAQEIPDGSFGWGILRVFFQFIEMPSGNLVPVTGINLSTTGVGASLIVSNNGIFGVRIGVEPGSFSASALTTGVWYRADLTYTLQAGAAGTSTLIGSVYTESGTLIDTLTVSAVGYHPLPNSNDFGRPTVGNLNNYIVITTYKVKFDDLYYEVNDTALPTFPTATRVTRMDITSLVSNIAGMDPDNANWQGNYLSLTEVPFEQTIVDQMTSMSLDAQIFFGHKTAAQLGISGIEGIQFYFQIKASIAGDESFLINSNTLTLPVLTAYGAVGIPIIYTYMQAMTNTDFDNLIFGLGNRRSLLVTVANLYAEVLHAGSNLPVETGTTSWKHYVGTYVGNGGFQTITGVGFKPHFVLVKKAGGVNNGGIFKTSQMGGTHCKMISSATEEPIGVMLLNSDGFTIGPATSVNQSGITYMFLCIQDFGFGIDCQFLRVGGYLGPNNAIDNYDIVVHDAWQPTFVAVQDGAVLDYRTDDQVGDKSVPLSASGTFTNLIQALNADGFEVGTTLNGSRLYYYLAIKWISANLATMFDYGVATPTGATHTISGLGFQPDLIIAKRLNAIGDAQWRQADVHAGTNSTLWSNITTNTTGITAINAGGFAVGSSIATNGVEFAWIAFKLSGTVDVANLTPTVDAGPNQNVNAFTAVVLSGSVTSSNYPCAVITSLWSKVSGPGIATFVDATDPTSNVNFDASGVYVLQLFGSNSLLTATDTITITVTNVAPVVNAGPNQTVLIGNPIVALNGTATDDGLPVPPGVLVTTWSKISGPGTVVFTDASALVTFATFANAGVFVIQLSTYDGEKTTIDSLTITIIDACVLPSADPVFNC